MTGYDSTHLAGMMEKVTAGATGAMGNIEMTGFDAEPDGNDGESDRRCDCCGGRYSDDRFFCGQSERDSRESYSWSHRCFREHSDDRFSADNLSGMMEKVTAGATGAWVRSG